MLDVCLPVSLCKTGRVDVVNMLFMREQQAGGVIGELQPRKVSNPAVLQDMNKSRSLHFIIFLRVVSMFWDFRNTDFVVTIE